MKSNNKILPIISYSNAANLKMKILKDNKNKPGIYRWNNLITSKTYIGSSINLTDRLGIYYSKKAMLSKLNTSSSIIYSAILKYGHNKFSLDILEYCEIDLLIVREQYYLDRLKPEYNILKIANSRLGSKQTEATKIKISLSQKGEKHYFFGKIHSSETRIKISEGLKSSNSFRYYVQNRSKNITIETRLKKSLRCKGVKITIIDKENNYEELPTMTSVALKFNVSISTIRRYLDNNKLYKGYLFKSNFSIENQYHRSKPNGLALTLGVRTSMFESWWSEFDSRQSEPYKRIHISNIMDKIST